MTGTRERQQNPPGWDRHLGFWMPAYWHICCVRRLPFYIVRTTSSFVTVRALFIADIMAVAKTISTNNFKWSWNNVCDVQHWEPAGMCQDGQRLLPGGCCRGEGTTALLPPSTSPAVSHCRFPWSDQLVRLRKTEVFGKSAFRNNLA